MEQATHARPLNRRVQPIDKPEIEFRSIVHGLFENLIIYVDDILVLTESVKAMLSVKKQFSKMYTVKDLDEAEYFLGVKLERKTSTVKLTRTSYIKSVLDRFGMLECKPSQTHMSDPVSLMINQIKNVPFREVLGSVLYLSMGTRPDIAVAVSILSKHVKESRPAHWEGVKRIIRYLKATMTQGLQYEAVSGEQNSLSIHCDADWGKDPKDFPSRTRYASLRMRTLSISNAGGFLVISCGKVEYNKFSYCND
jgi:Reverse transcriptase (RNA-dependent DNA polymerase)